MKTLNTLCPSTTCEEFTRKELVSLKDIGCWSSWHPVMERILSRSIEMKPVYKELSDKFGSNIDCSKPELRLTLEAIWHSGENFNQEAISHEREVQSELEVLHNQIPLLAIQLSDALRRQQELYNKEDFSPSEFLNVIDVVKLAGEHNGHFKGWVQEKLDRIDGQFDGKYWPDLHQLVSAIGDFESLESVPKQNSIPEDVMDGRSSIIKDFVLTLDKDLKDCRQIPNSFVFSNSSMATIVNVVLDLPITKIATTDTVRVIRNRRRVGAYKKVI